MRLSNKIAVIVGAGQSPGEGMGNGRATALRFAAEGARLLAIDRNIASAEGFTIAASALGKTKMVLQVCAVAVLIAGATHASLKPLALVLLWLVVASALISAAQYFFRFWNQLDTRITQRRKLRMMEARAKSEDVVPS